MRTSAISAARLASESGADDEREVSSARRRWISASASVGLEPVPDPAVSSLAVTLVVPLSVRSSSELSENIVV